jgi:hypothetical protein
MTLSIVEDDGCRVARPLLQAGANTRPAATSPQLREGRDLGQYSAVVSNRAQLEVSC